MYKEIIINTFDTIFKNSNNLIQKLIIPTILISILNFYAQQYINPKLIDNININTIDPISSLLPITITFMLIMINISIAVTTHRVSILGANSVPKLGSYILGLREFKFLLKSILLGLIIAIPLIAVSLIPVAGIFIAPILAILLISRLSLIFPAISCDAKLGFYEIWKITREYKTLTFLMIIVFPFIFSLTVGIVYTFAIEFLIKLVSVHMIVLYSILNVFILVFSISALSSVYKYINPKPLNESTKNMEEPLKEIIQSSRRGLHKLIIQDKYNVDFNSLKKELEEQYLRLGFSELAYSRKNSWLIKNPEDEEAYISLRYEGDEYFIYVKNSDEPTLKIIQKPKNKNKNL